MRVLVVDDEEIKRVSLVDDLSASGHDAVPAQSGEEALKLLAGGNLDVVVTDLRMPGIDGMDLLKQIKCAAAPGPEVILMTAYGSIPVAVEAMKIGAFDFITKPFRNETILPLLARIEEARKTPPEEARDKAKADRVGVETRIVGDTPAMREVRQMAALCARTDATVLLTGETGSGKDLLAATIHGLSRRRSSPFVKVSCAVFPDHLVESELYGHEKGAFTGADQQRKGKFDMAQGGTLYLDDVDDIPPAKQMKFLRVIEEKVFERVGASAAIEADVRIIAATKKNLLSEIATGTFRSDLYYRLNVLRIDLPPLRKHLGDLPLLVEHLLTQIAPGRQYRLDPDAMEFLTSHTWPGNVRELANALERAFLAGNGVITADALSAGTMGLPQTAPAPNGRFKATILQAERQLLLDALSRANGNRSAAARSLDMKLSTFRDKLAKHGLS